MSLLSLALVFAFADPCPASTQVTGEITSDASPSLTSVLVQCACLPGPELLHPDSDGHFSLYRAPAGTYRFSLLGQDERELDATTIVVSAGEPPDLVWLDSRGEAHRARKLTEFRNRRSPQRTAPSKIIAKAERVRARPVQPPHGERARQSPEETIGLVFVGAGAALLTPALFSIALGGDWLTTSLLGVPGAGLAAAGAAVYASGRRRRLVRVNVSPGGVAGQF